MVWGNNPCWVPHIKWGVLKRSYLFPTLKNRYIYFKEYLGILWINNWLDKIFSIPSKVLEIQTKSLNLWKSFASLKKGKMTKDQVNHYKIANVIQINFCKWENLLIANFKLSPRSYNYLEYIYFLCVYMYIYFTNICVYISHFVQRFWNPLHDKLKYKI